MQSCGSDTIGDDIHVRLQQKDDRMRIELEYNFFMYVRLFCKKYSF